MFYFNKLERFLQYLIFINKKMAEKAIPNFEKCKDDVPMATF